MCFYGKKKGRFLTTDRYSLYLSTPLSGFLGYVIWVTLLPSGLGLLDIEAVWEKHADHSGDYCLIQALGGDLLGWSPSLQPRYLSRALSRGVCAKISVFSFRGCYGHFYNINKTPV
ncbi:unnamed protein product [Ectocarpus sp. 12 AP-2014]